MAWKGFNTKVAFAKNSNAWATGTAVALGTGHQVYITSEGLTPNAQLIPSESLTGSPFPAPGDKGDELHAGALSVEWDYETIHRFLAFAMGTAGVPTEIESDGAYRHDLRFANSLEGIYTTLAIGEETLFVREYPMCKHNGWTLSVEHNQRVTGDFGMIPRNLNFNTTAGVNELTNIVDWTLPTNADTRYLTFNDLLVQINAYDASDFVSPDDDLAFVSSVSIDAPGAMLEDDVTTSNAPYVDEPLRNGDVVITGTLNSTKLNDTNQLTELLSKDRLKMKWTFDSGVVIPGTTTNWSLEVFFSNVQIAEADINVPGKELAPKNLTFQASKASTAHVGFDYTDAMYVRVTNSDVADPLA